MIRPKKISSFINRILVRDPKLSMVTVHSNRRGALFLTATLYSVTAFVDLKEEIDLPLIDEQRTSTINPDSNRVEGRYILQWDVSSIRDSKLARPYSIVTDDGVKSTRKEVTGQEDRAAEMIGGMRHAGSGSIPGLKSDASSGRWQLEAKSTQGKGIRVELSWLSKITFEANRSDKDPIVHIWFRNVPSEVVVEDEWVMVPRSVFERLK
jgi:hypothetical protein